MPPQLVIETQALCKRYGAQKALDGISLQVAPGAIGLLGPNGAGKSTFMKCLLQLQPITSGSARLLGREVGHEGRDIRKRVGYTPEQDCHIPGMVGCEYVAYCAQLCGLPFQAARQRAHDGNHDFVADQLRPMREGILNREHRIDFALFEREQNAVWPSVIDL